MTTESVLYVVALGLIALVSLAALWHPNFRDNVLQTVGLAAMCFGAAMGIYGCVRGDDLLGARYALTYGMAIYAVGTAFKFWKFNRSVRPDRLPPRRRSTDHQPQKARP